MTEKKEERTRKNQLPFAEGYFTTPLLPTENVRLVGSKCRSCGISLFGRRHGCESCASTDLEDITLGKLGKVYSYSFANYAPPQPYAGSVDPFVPYAIAWIDLSEGVRILSTLTHCDPEDVKIGMDVELVVEKGWEDSNGDEVFTYKFTPVKAS